MNPLNKKMAFGAVAGGVALATGGIISHSQDKKLSKEHTEALNNIKGNSKDARKARIQINKDYDKESDNLNLKQNLITAGAVVAAGATGVGIAHFTS